MAGGCVWWGACVAGGHAWQGVCVVGGVWGACMAGGACVAGGMCGEGACMTGGMHATHAPPPHKIRAVNARAVCILLECILVPYVMGTHIHDRIN